MQLWQLKELRIGEYRLNSYNKFLNKTAIKIKYIGI